MELLRRYDANPAGRDFAVGDIHGHFKLLDTLLADVVFDPRRDRLFSVGDLIDRGPDSARAAEFLGQPWFHAVRGNHEQMLLDATTSDGAVVSGEAAYSWRLNGGGWFFDLPPDRRAALRHAVRDLPVAAQIDGLDIGLVHGDVPLAGWAALCAGLSGWDAGRQAQAAIWGRRRASGVLRRLGRGGAREDAVPGIGLVLLGHTPMPCPVAMANTRWLDTGAGHGRPLTLMDLAADRVWQAAPGGARSTTIPWNLLDAAPAARD